MARCVCPEPLVTSEHPTHCRACRGLAPSDDELAHPGPSSEATAADIESATDGFTLDQRTERSNYRVILGDCRDGQHRPGLVQIYGSHGYQALAYDATLGPVPADDDLCELLERSQNYPVLDDDDLSELEQELETEAWESHGRGDFRDALVAVLDELDAGHEHEIPDDDDIAPATASAGLRNPARDEPWSSLLNGLWSEGCDELSVNGGCGYNVETGGGVHFYIADWVEKAGHPTDRAIHGTLREIAIASRVAE